MNRSLLRLIHYSKTISVEKTEMYADSFKKVFDNLRGHSEITNINFLVIIK